MEPVRGTKVKEPVAEMRVNRVGYALIAFGVLVALVAVLADPLIGGEPGYSLGRLFCSQG